MTTEIIGVFDDKNWIMLYALDFSVTNNIVESKEWANLILENGIDGGGNAGLYGPNSPNYGLIIKPHTEEHKQK